VEALLAASLAVLGYTYVGYPLLAALLALIARRPHSREAIEPSVSLVICAYNEERDIAAKLENSLALDYPADKLEIVVASDGSTDRTDEIVRGFADRGVRLFRAEDHPGKAGTTNRVVETTRGEILIFSDATGHYAPESVRALVRNFADETVGAATGRVAYRYAGSAASQGFRLYQRLVVFARRSESEWGTETSMSGSICALRRTLFRPIPPHLDFDFCHPLHVAQAGMRTVYEADAVSLEEAREDPRAEFAARVRMGILAFSFVAYLIDAAAQIRSPAYAFQIISHKLLRWFSPLLLVLLFVLTAVLAAASPLALLLLFLQLLFYGTALVGYAVQSIKPLARLFGVPLFFVTINLAFLVALARYISGERIGTWEPDRP
jgi:cellulose synthase/poly-beta-1,6-N-acetylglucosamine synthase-like glycosyltransferase